MKQKQKNTSKKKLKHKKWELMAEPIMFKAMATL